MAMFRLYNTRYALQVTKLIECYPTLLNRESNSGVKLLTYYFSKNVKSTDDEAQAGPGNPLKQGGNEFLVKRVLPAVAFGGTAVVAAPYALTSVGFTSAGIASKSLAAAMMSMYGGAVPAGGIVATLQSAGAAGIVVAGKISIFSTTSLSSYGVAELGSRIKQKMKNKSE